MEVRGTYGFKKNEINYYKLGEKIRSVRIESGMTQKELAEKADISINYLSHIENGLAKFSFPVLIQLINALEVTPNDILQDFVTNKRDNKLQDIYATLETLDYVKLDLMKDYINLMKKYKIVK